MNLSAKPCHQDVSKAKIKRQIELTKLRIF